MRSSERETMHEPSSEAAGSLAGVLHIYVAFDWGDAIGLEKARGLVPASFQELPRRRRTPSSFSYRPPPLHMALAPTPLELAELGRVEAQAGLTVFDFAGVSLALRVPLTLPAEALIRLAGSLADPTALVQAARTLLQPIFDTLRPAIEDAAWDADFSEEYFVFQLSPDAHQPCSQPPWLAGIVHLESGPLSAEEVQEALRLKISYSPDDLFVPDWAAAVLIDKECEETLQAIEFANLQLLEYRHIDHRLDQSLAAAQRTIAPLARSPLLPFWHHARPLRELGALKVEANDLFERAGNVLKLVGDPYLARVYRLVAQRFHLEVWEKSIQRKLEAAEGAYQVVSDQASSYRTEFLEIIVVLLILIEIVMAFVRH
jgi:hypothetical protein